MNQFPNFLIKDGRPVDMRPDFNADLAVFQGWKRNVNDFENRSSNGGRGRLIRLLGTDRGGGCIGSNDPSGLRIFRCCDWAGLATPQKPGKKSRHGDLKIPHPALLGRGSS
jgi:hypothetical protein